ncbi:MAG: glutathione S-transferase family protein [Pseudomonadota bacterium]
MLKVYGRANSINVRKVLWCAGELGLDVEREDWGRGFRATSDPAYQAINPLELVPTTVDVDGDGEVTLRDSHATIRYLAAKYGDDALYPADLVKRARVDAWMEFAGADTAVALRGIFIGGVVGQAPFNAPEFIATGRAMIIGLMGKVDATLREGHAFICGDTFTLADIPLGLVVNRYFVLIEDGPEYAALRTYYDRLNERPAYQEHGRNGLP